MLNNSNLDLNLLAVFEAVYSAGHVTRAAKNLHMSQPAVSNALARLREALSDPLFLRTGAGMEPTPRARRLIGPVREALALIEQGLGAPVRFDYASATRRFRLATSDYGEAVILPRLLDHLGRYAPGLRVEAVPIIRKSLPTELDGGEVDLAVGNIPFLDAAFNSRHLMEEAFVVVARRDHTSISGAELDLETFVKVRHVGLTPRSPDGAAVDQVLAAMGRRRFVVAEVPNFLSVPTIVAQTDLISTLPSRLADSYARPMGLKLLPLPLDLKPVSVRAYWHQRDNRDPAHEWLRGVLTNICRTL